MSRVKGFFLTPNEKGELKFEWIKAIAIAATTGAVSLFIIWAVWVTQQANVVATNKNLIMSTAEQLERGISSNKVRIEKNNVVLHMRSTKLDDKYDAKMTDMQKMLMQTNRLIVDMLIQKNEEVDLKKKEVEMQQQQQQQTPRWPMSPHNGDNR